MAKSEFTPAAPAPRPLSSIMEDVSEVADSLRILQDMGTDVLARCTYTSPDSSRTAVEQMFFLLNQMPAMVTNLTALQAEALSGQGVAA